MLDTRLKDKINNQILVDRFTGPCGCQDTEPMQLIITLFLRTNFMIQGQTLFLRTVPHNPSIV